MSPAFYVGDLIAVTNVRPADIRPGDIVTFRDPEKKDRIITHRTWPWREPARASGCAPVATPTYLGYVADLARTPGGLVLFFIIPGGKRGK